MSTEFYVIPSLRGCKLIANNNTKLIFRTVSLQFNVNFSHKLPYLKESSLLHYANNNQQKTGSHVETAFNDLSSEMEAPVGRWALNASN